ncbi:MAG: TIR domain-containing protein [Clostridia bacterium]|nr:TIR domain-containing protein [Clostridia bacterium]
MAIIKCKMCGGDLILTEGSTVAECEYCGSVQTVPTADNDKKMTLFARANRLRAACEFDKAAGVFESVVADFPEEAEAYWGLVLCRYGIEYVDDPATGKKIPTCHRSSFDSVMDDKDFEQVMENSDALSRKVYREEAKRIEELRKSIIEVSGKEEPYDIFICYKETAEVGQRTIDSVLAQDIYDKLNDAGYRVFFSRITLEDKLGQEYEPYVFAALNSAKIMLVFGTDYEYFNAVWVKNEWSRFLKLMEKDKTKRLIPCFKDIDAYDMPKEFSKLQSQDMGKVGADQDLIRAIKKLLPKEDTKEIAPVHSFVQSSPGANTSALLNRAFLYLEDGEWKNADEYAEKVLDYEPENARAYLVKLMAELRVSHQTELAGCKRPFEGNYNYLKIARFGEPSIVSELSNYIDVINERIKDEEAFKENNIVELVADALMRANPSAPTLKERISSANKRIEFIKGILICFDDIKEQIGLMNNEIRDYSSKQTELTAQKSKLGIFAGKEKKQIDYLLSDYERKKDSVRSRLNQLETKLQGYASREEIEHDLEKATAFAKKLETLSETNHNNTTSAYSYNEALDIYKKRRDVALAVKELFPEAPPISYMFGRYIQKKGSPSEPIEWQVYAVENDCMLLISKYALDYKQYNFCVTSVTWETCSLRKWLNNSFYITAFTSEERSRIVASKVSADKNPKYSSTPGKGTTDKVFLLSVLDVEKYYRSETERLCAPTYYTISEAEAYNSYVSPYKIVNGKAKWVGGKANDARIGWWLRTPGEDPTKATKVTDEGWISPHCSVSGNNGYGYAAIRPAMWVRLDNKVGD